MPLATPSPAARRSRSSVESRRSSRKAAATRGAGRRPQTQSSVRAQERAAQRHPPLYSPMQHYPLAPHPRPQPQEQDMDGVEDEQELRELAAVEHADELGTTRPHSRSPTPTHFGLEARSSSPMPMLEAGTAGLVTPLQANAAASRYTMSPVFETPSDSGDRLSPGRENFIADGTQDVDPILIGGGKFPASRPYLASMLIEERDARQRTEARARQSIEAAQVKMKAMEDQVAALRFELSAHQEAK